MGLLSDPIYVDIGKKLAEYKKDSLLKIASGMLTLPELAANAVRLESLVHLTIIYANGNKTPTRTLLKTVLNDLMGSTMIASMEDPIEDVFVSNIQTGFGDCLVFNGIWEGNDYFIQTLIDLVDRSPVPNKMKKARDCCIALIRLSNEVASRSNLKRNESSESSPKLEMKTPPSSLANSISNRVEFYEKEIEKIGINLEDLAPFIISDNEIEILNSERVGNSTLERKPIVAIGGSYVVALPNAIGISIRKYFLEECKDSELIKAFQLVLAEYQTVQLKSELLRELKREGESIMHSAEGIPNLPPCSSLLLKTQSDKYYHFLIIHDDLVELLEQGFDSFHSIKKENEKAIYSFIARCAEQCKAQNNFHQGTTLFIHGGLGRGIILGFNDWPDNWNFVAISLADLSLLSFAGGEPLDELIYSSMQSRWLQDNGIHVQNCNGDINFYGFWRDNEYECCPAEISLDDNNHISLDTGHVFPLRRDLRIASDKHCVIDAFGNHVRCERLTKDSYFEGMRTLPIYACIDHFKKYFLNGLISLDFASVWFGISEQSPNIEKSEIFEWWSGFINLLYECLLFFDSEVSLNLNEPIQVNLDLLSLVSASEIAFDSSEERDISTQINGNLITLTLDSNFLANFGQDENIGERKLISEVLSALGQVLLSNDIDIIDLIPEAIEEVLSDSGVRIIHLYKTFDIVEVILIRAAEKPTYVSQPVLVFNGLVIGKSTDRKNEVLKGKENCRNYLHFRVDLIWSKIKSILNSINRTSLLVALIKNINSIEQDRENWSRTAKSVKAIHQKHDDVTLVASSIESKRSLASLCCRVLIEMSVCECPAIGGDNSNSAKLETLISLCALLVNTATDSDAIHSDLIEPLIEIQPNGSHKIPADVWSSVLLPYYTGYFERQFSESIASYADLYSEKQSNESASNGDFPEDYSDAFKAEYGFTPSQYSNCIGEIMDQIILSGNEYILIDKDELINAILTYRGIPMDVIQKFIECFSLKSRSHWDKLPKDYVFRDIAPWKHKRKLSCLVRPLIESGSNQLLCSLALIKQSSMYFLERTINGLLIPDFYSSTEMRSFVGGMIERRGAEFTNAVKEYFEDRNWQVASEVLMSSLGAPQELGDIDVLTLSNDGRLIAIECKNLQMAKTISEVADVLNRFKGHGEKDELLKHIERVGWVTENITQVIDRVRFNGEVKKFENYLLTNTEMPMRYSSGLPIDVDNIKSFRNINEII